MYPHVHDVLSFLSKKFNLNYIDSGNRGTIFFDNGINIFQTFQNSYNRNRKNRRVTEIINRALSERFYDFIITIDHYSLYLLNKIKRSNYSRVVFWSLDFISYDHPWYLNHKSIRRFVEQSKKDLKICEYIIIQDEFRAACFDSIYLTGEKPKIFLPVSIHNSKNLSKRFNVVSNTNIVQLGSIHSYRGSLELIRNYQNCDDRIRLHLKGHVARDASELNQKMKNKAIIDSKIDHKDEMRKFLLKMHIGYTDLKHSDLNSYFISCASGQVAEFTHLGLPMIIAGNTQLKQSIKRFETGILIDRVNPNEFTKAIKQIINNFDFFSRNSLKLFKEKYDLAIYHNRLLRIFKS